MNEKLSYEDWHKKYMLADPLSDKDRSFFKTLDIDIDIALEEARRREYEFYINGGFEK